MNRNQWYILWIVFLLIGIYFATISAQASIHCRMFSNEFDIACIRAQIFSPFVYLFLILSFTCLICAWLEPKKMEDDAPKEHREIIKLARLEHEVKELKSKLKSKIKS